MEQTWAASSACGCRRAVHLCRVYHRVALKQFCLAPEGASKRFGEPYKRVNLKDRNEPNSQPYAWFEVQLENE